MIRDLLLAIAPELVKAIAAAVERNEARRHEERKARYDAIARRVEGRA